MWPPRVKKLISAIVGGLQLATLLAVALQALASAPAKLEPNGVAQKSTNASKNDATAKSNHDHQQQQHPLRIHHKLTWIDGPELVRGFGEQKLITGCINTWDNPSQVSVSTNFSHLFQFDAGDDLIEQADVSADEIAQLLAQDTSSRVLFKHKTNLTRTSGHRSLVRSKIMLEKRSMSVVMFRGNTIELRGRVRKTLDRERNLDNLKAAQQQLYAHCLSRLRSSMGPIKKIDCHKQVQETLKRAQPVEDLLAAAAEAAGTATNKLAEEFDLLIRATELDSNGTAVGSFAVDYFGTEQYKHPAFYNLADKFVDMTGGGRPGAMGARHLGHDHVKSPFACAELSLAANRSIALYDINKMRCLVADEPELEPGAASSQLDRLQDLVKLPAGEFLYDNRGHPLGEYRLSKWALLRAHWAPTSGQDPSLGSNNVNTTSSSATRTLGASSLAEGPAKLPIDDAIPLATSQRKLVRLWTDERRCDLIDYFEGKFHCVRLASRPAQVLMLRRQLVGVKMDSGTSLLI